MLNTTEYSCIWSCKGVVSMILFSNKEEERCLKQPNQL